MHVSEHRGTETDALDTLKQNVLGSNGKSSDIEAEHCAVVENDTHLGAGEIKGVVAPLPAAGSGKVDGVQGNYAFQCKSIVPCSTHGGSGLHVTLTFLLGMQEKLLESLLDNLVENLLVNLLVNPITKDMAGVQV